MEKESNPLYSKIKSGFQKFRKIAIMAIATVFITVAIDARDKKEVIKLQEYDHNLQVFPKDIGYCTYSEAVEACNAVNSAKSHGYDDWRLPTLHELGIMYRNYSKIEKMKDGVYLSNEKCDDGGYQIRVFDDYVSKGEKPAEYYFMKCASKGIVRFVRTDNNKTK